MCGNLGLALLRSTNPISDGSFYCMLCRFDLQAAYISAKRRIPRMRTYHVPHGGMHALGAYNPQCDATLPYLMQVIDPPSHPKQHGLCVLLYLPSLACSLSYIHPELRLECMYHMWHLPPCSILQSALPPPCSSTAWLKMGEDGPKLRYGTWVADVGLYQIYAGTAARSLDSKAQLS